MIISDSLERASNCQKTAKVRGQKQLVLTFSFGFWQLRITDLEPVLKLPSFEFFLGTFTRRAAVYTDIHEDPSMNATTKKSKIGSFKAGS